MFRIKDERLKSDVLKEEMLETNVQVCLYVTETFEKKVLHEVNVESDNNWRRTHDRRCFGVYVLKEKSR